MSVFQQDNAPGLMGPPGPRGHKRQRSRSVPVAVDVNMLRHHPIPSFFIQQDGQPAQAPMQDPNIFAPIPQHQHQFVSGPGGPNLSIDTSGAFPGFQFGGPVSATTVNSPSDYGTPAFFTSGPSGEPITHFNNPFDNGFLAVDPTAMIGTTSTPLSMVSHGDPAIADHSPPLNGVGRSHSTDFFGTPGDHSQFGDEGLYLSESFNKHMQLPFRSPHPDDFHSPMPDGSFNFTSPQTTGVEMNGHQAPMNFQSPPHQTRDGSISFHSPPSQSMHQDSGVSFSTPSDQPSTDHSPKTNGVFYQDSKMYTSPAQLHHLPHDQHLYHGTPAEELEFNNLGMFGTINPNSLGQHQQH